MAIEPKPAAPQSVKAMNSPGAPAKPASPFSAVPKAPPSPFRRDRLKQIEEKANFWIFYASPGTKLEHLTDDPARWAVFHDLLKNRFDHVEVVSNDSSWWAELLVNSSSTSGVQMVLLRSMEMPEVTPEDSSRLPKEFKFSEDPEHGLIVTRIKDNVFMGSSLENGWKNREDAVRYILDHATVRQPVS